MKSPVEGPGFLFGLPPVASFSVEPRLQKRAAGGSLDLLSFC
jgi:hypothetical protein